MNKAITGGVLFLTACVAAVAIVQLVGVSEERDALIRQRNQLREEVLSNELAITDQESVQEEIQDLRDEVDALSGRPRVVYQDRPRTRREKTYRRKKEEKRPSFLETLKLKKKGFSIIRKGSYFPAVSLFEQWARGAPYDPMPIFYLSYLAMTSDNWGRSLYHLGRLIGLDEDWLRKAPDPGRFFGSAKEYRKFLVRLETHIAGNPGDAEAKALLAFHLYFTEDGTHAKAMATEALALDPEQPEAKALVGQLEQAGF